MNKFSSTPIMMVFLVFFFSPNIVMAGCSVSDQATTGPGLLHYPDIDNCADAIIAAESVSQNYFYQKACSDTFGTPIGSYPYDDWTSVVNVNCWLTSDAGPGWANSTGTVVEVTVCCAESLGAQPPEHFTCYQVRPEDRQHLKLKSLEDQFLYQKDIKVKGPVEICAPADKNSEGVNNWEDHLVCYKVYSKQKVKESVVVKNQFGTQLLHVKGKTRRLCVPSKKRVCNDVYWTDWLDRDNQGGTGDWETIDGFLKDKPPVQICGGNDPVGIKCKTLDDGTDWQDTGEANLICDPSYGFRCRNEDQPDGTCEDYKVRFKCCE